MMVRYWLLKDDRVLGPFGPEELGGHPDLRPEALLCPESPGESPTLDAWVKAESVPELAALLKERKALGPEEVYTPSRPVFLDHPVLAAILRKVEDLEEALTLSQMKAEERERDISELKDLLAFKEASETGLRDTIRSLVEKTARMNEVLAELAELRRQVNESAATKAAAFDALRSGVEEFRAEAAAAKGEREDLRKRLESLESEMRSEAGLPARKPPSGPPAALLPEAAGIPAEADAGVPVLPPPPEPSAKAEPDVPALPPPPEPSAEAAPEVPVLPPPPEPAKETRPAEPVAPPLPQRLKDGPSPPGTGLSMKVKLAGFILAALLGLALAYFLNRSPEPKKAAPLPAPALEAPKLPEPEPPKPRPMKKASKKKPVKKKRRPRKRAKSPVKKTAKTKELPPKEKEAVMRRKIMNNLRLRLSGGQLSAGEEP